MLQRTARYFSREILGETMVGLHSRSFLTESPNLNVVDSFLLYRWIMT